MHRTQPDADGERREYGAGGAVSFHTAAARTARIEKSLPPKSTKGSLPSLHSMTGERLTTNGPIRPHEAEKNVGIVAGRKNLKLFLN